MKPLTIYGVTYSDYDNYSILGLYRNRADAEEHLRLEKSLPGRGRGMDIEEFTLEWEPPVKRRWYVGHGYVVPGRGLDIYPTHVHHEVGVPNGEFQETVVDRGDQWIFAQAETKARVRQLIKEEYKRRLAAK